MRLSTWRPSIKSWLSRKLRITSFDLKQPTDYENIICFLPPLSNITITEGSYDVGTAVQEVYLTIRYLGDLKYVDLPLAEAEGLIVSLQLLLATGFSNIADLKQLTLLDIEEPIKVSEYGDGMADWLMTLRVAMQIVFIAEPEGALDYPNSDTVVKLSANLYTEHLEPKPPYLAPPDSHKDVTNRDNFGTINQK